MNKIFKVVWSKTKECYVVVSEVAKNNGGKKKVLASVLAGLAMVGAGTIGTPVQAYKGLGGNDDPSVETLAVGPYTWANQEAAVAVGIRNNANGQPAGKHSVAIGNFSNANGEISIAMGGVTNASGKMSVAVGYQASATDEAAVALGNMVSADKNSTGVGPGATASGTYAFAGGYQSETTGISGVAIGDNAKAKAARAMAIGGHAEATAEQAIAIGSDTGAGDKTTASKKNAIAVGHGATAKGLDTAAIGTSATASGQSSVALGNGTQSTNLNTTAIGSNVQSTKTGSIGIGGNVESIGDYSVAIGSASAGKTVKAVDYATAVGGLSNAAERAAALGAGADAAQARSVAIGYKATASTADGVAIGSTSVASTAAGVQGFNPADSRTNKYGGLTSAAQTSTLAAVSIGNGSAQTRQITGLAAGKEDTDAVNVAQLRSVNLKYAADTGNSDFLLTDGTLTVNGDGDLISTSVESTGAIKVTAKKGGNITHTDGKAVKPTTNGIATTDNVVDAINDSYWKATAGGNTVGTVGVGNVKPGNKVTFSAGDNLKVKQSLNNTTGDQEYTYSLNPVLTGITSIANTAGGPTMTFGGNSINITGGSLDMGTNKITNLAPGTADNDAVNVKQLKDTELHITPGTYTPDANKKVKLTYTDGNSTVVSGKEAVIDLSGLATGGTASTEKVKKAANGTNDTNIAEVNPQTGDTFGGAGATYEVSVSRNAVKDAAREAVKVNNGGTKSGTTYTPNADNPITVTPKEDAANHNTTYEVTFDGNKAAKQIPLTYKATNGTTTTADQTVKLDKGLNFTGGDYTTASVGADGKVTFDVNLGTAPTVTDGKPGVPGQDGIASVKTVVDTINNSGWKANAKANGGNLDGSATATVVKPGNTVNYAAGKNLIVNQELEKDASNALTGNQTYTYSLNKDIDLTNAGSLTVGDTTVNNGGITIKAPTPAAGTTATTTDVKLTNTGLDNGGNKIVNVAEGTADTDAVNVKQLKDAKTVLADGKNTKKSGTGTAADPYKVNVEGDLTGISSITNDGTNNGKISFGPNKTVTVDGDHSITLNASTGKISGLQNKTFDPTNFTSGQAATEDQLKSVHDTLKASELHIAPTAGTTNNVAEYTVDANNKVTLTYQDGNGTAATAPKAVIDLSALANKITSGYTFNTNAIAKGGAVDGSASVKAVDNGGTINYAAGKNLTVKQEIDTKNKTQTYTYSLDKDINVETVTVTGQNGKDGKIGINGKDGVTRTISVEVPGQLGQPGTPGVDGTTTTRIVFDDKAQANLDDGLKFTGNNESTENKHKLNTLVKVQGEGTKEGTNAAGTKEIQTSDGTKFESAKDNIAVEANNGDTLTVKLNKKLKGLDSVQTKTVELGDHTTPGGTTNITYNSGDKRIEYTTPGATAGTTETKKVATTDDIWTIQGNGTDVKPVNGKVNVKAGENILITTPTTANGTMTINAVTPAVYTDKDGNKLTKDKDGKFHKPDGTEVAPADVITSIQDAAGNVTGGNSIVNNVGSAINNHATPGVTSPTYLDKLDAAAGDTKTQNAAVNVTDLKNTADGLTDKGLKFNANEGGVKTNKLGSTVTVQGSGALTAGKAYADEYNTANIRTNISQNNGDTVINVGLAKALKDINSVSNGSSSITLNSNPGGTNNTPAVQITGGNLSMGNNKIVNLAPGTNDTDAVNYSQIKGLRTEVKQGSNVTVSKTQGTDGHDIYTISATATGGTASSWNIKSSADTANGGATATGHDANAVNISDQKTVEMVAGKNLTVKQTPDANGAKVEFALSDNIVAGKDGVNGKDGSVGATGKDGSSVVINGADGSIGMTGPKGQDGKDGINGRDGANISMTSAKGEQVLINRDPAHNADTDKAERIVYVPKDASGNPIKGADNKNIVREVATMDDGMKYAGDDAQGTDKSKVIAKKLNKTLDIIGGADKDKLTDNNIGVNNDGNGKLKVQLSKEITGLTSVQIGGNTIKTDGDHITITSPDTTSGATPGSTVTNKVANLDDEMHIKDTEYTVGSDKKVRLTYVDGNGNPVDNKTAVIDLSGLPVGDKDTDMRIAEGTYTAKNGTVTLKTVNKDGTAANKDVVIKGINTDQYKAGDNVTFTPDGTDANGNPIYKINADLSGASSTEKVIRKNDTNNLAKVDTQSTHVAGDKGETYIVSVDKNDVKDAAREAVEVKGSGVIKVTADTTTTPHKTTYDVAYDPDKAAEVTKISYKSSTSPDAGSQGPKKVSLKDGFDFKSTGGNVKITTDNAGGIDFNVDLSSIHGVSQNIAVGGNVDPTSLTGTDTVTKGTRFDAGNNLVVKRTALNDTGLDHAISYELNKDLQGINSIRNANNGPVMNFNAGDIAISGGNLSMGDGTHNNKIVNVAPGTDKSDVATVGQLTKVVSSNGTVTIAPVYKDQDGAPVYDLSVTGVPGADPRVDQLAEEIGRVGAQGAALSALKPIQYDPLEPTQIMAGYGNYRGNSAVALGVAHYKNESTLIHGGVSWAGGSSHMMANAGVTWKVGNRDSEAAVADRYRKGPISSAYAMQQEMAAMKAQNAGLKGEVSDLKAENEQMKAQIAAMMAKLGL